MIKGTIGRLGEGMMFTELVCDCGESLIGDGYTVVLHCPNTENDIDVAPDSAPIYCDYED